MLWFILVALFVFLVVRRCKEMWSSNYSNFPGPIEARGKMYNIPALCKLHPGSRYCLKCEYTPSSGEYKSLDNFPKC